MSHICISVVGGAVSAGRLGQSLAAILHQVREKTGIWTCDMNPKYSYAEHSRPTLDLHTSTVFTNEYVIPGG